jgi:hypothetical protein
LEKSNADGLYGGIFLCGDKSFKVETCRIFLARGLKENESMIDYLLATTCGAQTSTLFATESSTKDIMWDTKLIDHQDYDFVVRFHKKYKLVAKIEPTTIYYLHSGRKIHFESCIAFVENNIEDVSHSLYNEYNLRIYTHAVISNAPIKFIKYFQKEATKYKEHLSYCNYLAIRKPETKMEKCKCKLEYLWNIFHLGTIR